MMSGGNLARLHVEERKKKRGKRVAAAAGWRGEARVWGAAALEGNLWRRGGGGAIVIWIVFFFSRSVRVHGRWPDGRVFVCLLKFAKRTHSAG